MGVGLRSGPLLQATIYNPQGAMGKGFPHSPFFLPLFQGGQHGSVTPSSPPSQPSHLKPLSLPPDGNIKGETPNALYIQAAELLNIPWLRNDAGILLHLKGFEEAGIRGPGSLGVFQEISMRFYPPGIRAKIAETRPDSLVESLKWFLLVMADTTAKPEEQAKAKTYAQELLDWMPLEMVTKSLARYNSKRVAEGVKGRPAKIFRDWERGYQQKLKALQTKPPAP